MRRSEVAPKLHSHLVKCDDLPHCHALVAPPTPRRLPEGAAVGRELSEAMLALERLKATARHLPNVDMITRTLARREAVQSSQIEGTRTQLQELFEYEATHSSDGLPADATVTERYVQALDLGLGAVRRAGARQALDLDLVRAMHRTLMQDAPAAVRPGQFRDIQAWIGSGRIENATFVPAPPTRITACMEELEASMLQYAPREDEQWTLSPVAQIAIAHAQFETIHPFADGNGRTGRLLMPVMLAAEGYPPLYLSGTLLRHRRAYYDALADIQLRWDWSPWLRLLGRAVTESCDSAIAIANDLELIRADWAGRLGGLRADATAHLLPTYLLGHPVVTVNKLADAHGISFVAASRAINQLVERKILTEPTQRRNRVFHAAEVLARLERE
ncbi:Fic family protein [Luteimonas terricola]|uniref:Protein adenylyltransferase n=1 Tax=Luteimonas terricola TaxID=645597 RepID=A0ABQ2EAF9_9GAMM|nr:Fic family protein [Luteimonas terricola]GGK03255.1 cell division protein Fic [Luteimonas terricola]